MDFQQIDLQAEANRFYLWEKLIEQKSITTARVFIFIKETKQKTFPAQARR